MLEPFSQAAPSNLLKSIVPRCRSKAGRPTANPSQFSCQSWLVPSKTKLRAVTTKEDLDFLVTWPMSGCFYRLCSENTTSVDLVRIRLSVYTCQYLNQESADSGRIWWFHKLDAGFYDSCFFDVVSTASVKYRLGCRDQPSRNMEKTSEMSLDMGWTVDWQRNQTIWKLKSPNYI